MSSEYTVVRNYLELITQLPWGIYSQETLDIKKAEKVLNRDHFGLEDVKERILEFIAIRQLKKMLKGPLFVLLDLLVLVRLPLEKVSLNP
jgi:ATP-dependent Lon protease